jgi:hypothetical protein
VQSWKEQRVVAKCAGGERVQELHGSDVHPEPSQVPLELNMAEVCVGADHEARDRPRDAFGWRGVA